MKHILVPTDFSNCALNALKVAADLARKMGATVHLVHVYEKPISGISLQFEVDIKELRKLNERIAEEMDSLAGSTFLEGIEVKRHIIADKQLWEMLSLDNLSEIDFIVMGSHGASGAREFFIGSNTQKIVQLAKVPVLIVKEYLKVRDIKNIVFASNFYAEAETGFAHIKQIAEFFGAKVHLLKVITPGHFEDTALSHQLMIAFATQMKLKNYTVNTYNSGKVEDGIHAFCTAKKADLVAMETHGRKGMAHFFMGSITEHVVNHTKLPMLTSHIEKLEEHYDIPVSAKLYPGYQHIVGV